MPVVDQEILIKPDENLTVWRYLDLDKFESILKDKSLFFCRSDKFSDPFEGTIPKIESDHRVQEEIKVANRLGKNRTTEEATLKSKQIAEMHKRLRRTFVVNCWHINKGESDAMWRLYLKSNEGVVIQSTVKRLRDAFSKYQEEIFISKVRYIDFAKDPWYHANDYPHGHYNVVTPIIHKRLAFAHESELRLFQMINAAEHNENYWNDQPLKMGKLIPCDINTLVEKIIVPPTADETVIKKVADLITKYEGKWAIKQSKLNEEPFY